MTWLPRLSRQQQAERRREAARLLRQRCKKFKKAPIARILGVSRDAVSQWAKQLMTHGLPGLAARPVRGRPSALTARQWRQLLRILKRSAQAAGFATDRWTLPRIQQLVKKRFNVVHSHSWLSRRLHQLNWSPQKPAPRAKERDEALIQAWLARDATD